MKTSLSLLSVNATHVLDTYIQLVLDKWDVYFTFSKFLCFCSQEHWNKTSQGRPNNIKKNLTVLWDVETRFKMDLLYCSCQQSRQLRTWVNNVVSFQWKEASFLKKGRFQLNMSKNVLDSEIWECGSFSREKWWKHHLRHV